MLITTELEMADPKRDMGYDRPDPRDPRELLPSAASRTAGAGDVLTDGTKEMGRATSTGDEPVDLFDGHIHTPTVWGLTPTQIHDRFWAAHGVQVVRQGEPSQIVEGAELFLLMDRRSLAFFKLARVIDTLYWMRPDLLFVRLHDSRERGYRERVVRGGPDGSARTVRVERIYGGSDSRLGRVALTRDRDLARAWQSCGVARDGWRDLRRRVPRLYRHTASMSGSVYDRTSGAELMQFVRHAVQSWKRPDATIGRARRLGAGGWADRQAKADPSARIVGSVWVGAGRALGPEDVLVGPTVLWDAPSARPAVEHLEWGEIERTDILARLDTIRPAARRCPPAKRAFDIAFALVAFALTFPIYPLVMLAIWLEDGRPFFFGHRRETIGGREFSCLKFRSMRKDAEGIKQKLAGANQADGPQFYIQHDPRMTTVGRLLRKFNIDELPQFLNVLAGDMSIVGPRPSPRKENQFCPPWREARLSVMPGITGLWQVKRTRRTGQDFQEWIRFDIEYVENAGWKLDLSIIWQTILTIVRG